MDARKQQTKKSRITKQKLLRILWVQEIDLFFTDKGFSKTAIFNRIISPTFFIDKKTYYNYLGINAKKLLKENYHIDWNKEKDSYRPVNFLKIMDDFKSTGNFNKDTMLFLMGKNKQLE